MSGNDTNTTIREGTAPMALEFGFGLLGNLLAVFLIFVNRKVHKWTSFYKFYFGLAMTDLSVYVLTSPMSIARYASNFTFDFPTPLCVYLAFMLMFCLLSSALILSAMTIDRFLSLRRPDKYENQGRIYTFVLISMWVIAGLISALPLMGVGSSHNYYPGSWCYLDYQSDKSKDIINCYIYAVTGLIALAIMVLVNLYMILKVCINSEYRGNLNDNGRSSGVYDFHTFFFLICVVIIFSSCWTPHLIFILRHAIEREITEDKKELLGIRLVLINTIINPWLYVIFRKESLKFFCKILNSCRTSICNSEPPLLPSSN